MFKQMLLPLAAVAVFIILVGIFTQKQSSLNLSKYFPGATSVQEKTLTIGSKIIQVEVAASENAREKGLGGRASLAEDHGMLFVFTPKQASPIFWMKDMLIPLDIIWISNGQVVKIDKNIAAPPPNTPDDKLDKIIPNKPVDYVLEVNAGFTDSNSIKVGDAVTTSGL